MTELELLKEIGKNVGLEKPLICPLCSNEPGSEQPLSSVGDYENELFCPHCDLGIELKLTSKGVTWKNYIGGDSPLSKGDRDERV